jgi:hypothetical protein
MRIFSATLLKCSFDEMVWVSFHGDYHFEHVLPMWFQVYSNLEPECRYPIPVECILDNLVAIICFC